MRKLVILGCGPGHRDYITPIGERKVREAQLLVGSPRLLALFPEFSGKRVVLRQNYQEILRCLSSWYKELKTVVLVTGDPGIHSYARQVIETIGIENCEVIPGISSVQLAFARLGLSWEEICILSLHGKDLDSASLIDYLNRFVKVVILTDKPDSAARISRILEEGGINRRTVYICQDLSLPAEQIWKTDTVAMAGIRPSSLHLIIILNQGPDKGW